MDRGGAGLEHYLAEYPEDEERIAELRRQIAALHAATPQPETIGPYRIRHRLGAGGAGIVYAATCEDHGVIKNVALKVLLDGRVASARQIAMFEREAKALAALEHPNIACIEEAGRTDDGQHWLAMELVEGLPLERYVEQGERGSANLLRLFVELCAGVGHAHGQGIVHRDLKPSNVIVESNGRPRIVDFGLARSVDGEFESMTRTGSVLGTLQFMSPEQARGERGVDARSDVYSLGVILYWLVVGSLPHDLQGVDLSTALRRIARPVHCPRLPDAWPAALSEVIETALEPDPRDRYAHAGALAERVRAVMSGRPVSPRGRRWLRRIRRPGIARIGLGLAGVTALIGTILAWAPWTGSSGEESRARSTKVAASADPSRLLRDLVGAGFEKISPFDAVDWRGEQPQVLVDGLWWELRSAAGHPAETMVKLARATSVRVPWTKRFEEDFYEILSRLEQGRPPNPLPLRLLNRDTQRIEERVVEMTEAKRRSSKRRHSRSPFAGVRWSGRDPEVRLVRAGPWWQLLEIESHSVATLRARCVELDPGSWRLVFELFLDYLLADLGMARAEEMTVRVCALDEDPQNPSSYPGQPVTVSPSYGRRLRTKWQRDAESHAALEEQARFGYGVFGRVRVRGGEVQVEHLGQWWTLVALGNVELAGLIEAARAHFPASWQQRIRVDMVPLAEWSSGQAVPDRVSVRLRPLDGGIERSTLLPLSEEAYQRLIARIRQEDRW